jgi:hypothetical protein
MRQPLWPRHGTAAEDGVQMGVVIIRGDIRACEPRDLHRKHQLLPQGHAPVAAVTLVANCLGDEAAAVTLDPVGSRPRVRLHAAINPRRSTCPLARH